MKNTESVMDLTKDTYNKIADKFEIVTIEKERKKFISYLNAKDLILDLGCGIGDDVKFFVDNGFCSIGIDNSKKMLDVAKRNAPDGIFKEMDMMDLKFQNDSIDAVWAKASLMHLPKSMLKSALSEVRRVLKNKGIFFLSLREGVGEKIERIERYDNKPRFFAYYKEKEIKKHLEELNFKIIQISLYNSYASEWLAVFCKKE